MAEPRLARDRRSRRADCRLRVLHADAGGDTRAFHLQADPRQDRASLRAAPPPAMRPSKGSARSMSRSCSCARGRGIRSSSLPLRWTGRLPQRPARRTLPRRSYENCGCSCWPNATIWVDEVEQRHGGRDRHHDFAEAGRIGRTHSPPSLGAIACRESRHRRAAPPPLHETSPRSRTNRIHRESFHPLRVPELALAQRSRHLDSRSLGDRVAERAVAGL